MADSKQKWVPVAEPLGMNPGNVPDTAGRKRKTGDKDQKNKDNIGGIVVYVMKTNTSPALKEEVARVGFIRETSENPKVDFKTKLDEVIQTAMVTADTLNSLNPEGELL